MRILAVGAHPGDAELQAGGTLARFVQEGHDVYIAYLTLGDKEGEGKPVDLAQTRAKEAREAARIIGASVLPGFTGDLELFDNNPDQRVAVADMIREARPDLLITHGQTDSHPDRRIAGRLVFHGAYAATLPNSVSAKGLPAHPVRAPICYMDPFPGLDVFPEEYVDISQVIDQKKMMIAAYRSRFGWYKALVGGDLLEDSEALSAWRGSQCKVAHAEGFSREGAQGRVRAARLLPSAPLEAGQDPGKV